MKDWWFWMALSLATAVLLVLYAIDSRDRSIMNIPVPGEYNVHP